MYDLFPGYYILVDGQPELTTDLAAYAAWFSDVANRRVAWTEVAPGIEVSTVFLGSDHGFGDGPPVLWETMVFWTDHPLDNECDRYTSQADAEAGHAAMVARVEAALEDAR